MTFASSFDFESRVSVLSLRRHSTRADDTVRLVRAEQTTNALLASGSSSVIVVATLPVTFVVPE
jgi:hypothetical protein